MTHEIVLDIETQNTFQDVGEGNHRGLRVSLVGIYEYARDAFSSFTEEELPKLWPILEHAERIIGYNSKFFDIPVLNNYYAGDLLRLHHFDVLEAIKERLGFRLKLDDVAKATLGIAKSSHGLQAVEWFKHGDMESIRRYCIDDVRITRDVYEYARDHKKLRYFDLGVAKEFTLAVPLPLTVPQQSINLTLPL